MNIISKWLVITTLLATAGCGLELEEDGFEAEVNGSVTGLSFTPVDAMFIEDASPGWHEVYIFDEGLLPAFCPSAAVPSDALGLIITFKVDELTVGTYQLDASDMAFAADFDDGGDPFDISATGGTVNVDEVGDAISGTFDLTFGEDKLDGYFWIPLTCSGS